MAIALKRYLSAGVPDDDTEGSGGARVATSVPLAQQFSAAARPEIVSDAAGDTMNVTITGRLASGEEVEETKALNGTTPVLFDATMERLLKVAVASGPAGNVEVRQGTGGTVRHIFAAGETLAAIHFMRSEAEAAGGAAEERYEKEFWRNEDGTLSLLGAEVELTADPDSRFEIGLDATVDATTSVANRLAAPGGVTFVDDGVAVAVPGTDLAAGEAIGVWIRQTLAAGAAAAKSTFTTEISGASA